MGTKRRPRSSGHRSGPRGRCRGCGADIYWLTCLKADGSRGAKAPIDMGPSFDGNIEVDVPAELYRVVPRDEAQAHRERCDAGVPPRLRKNHFASCTNVTYRRTHGRMRPLTPEELEAEAAWAADAPAPVAGPPAEPVAVAPAIALPQPGEFLVDPEEADGDPDE